MRRLGLAAGLGLAIVVLGVGLVRWASHPASTTTSSVDTQDPKGVLGTANSVTSFSSPYFSTQIPTGMQLKTSHENPGGAILAGYLFTNVKPSLSDQIAITVGNMGLNSLSETSGVKQRMNDPVTYPATIVENAPEGAVSFKRIEGYETAVFWQKGSKYVALVVSGPPQRQPELDQALQTVLTNWSWQ